MDFVKRCLSVRSRIHFGEEKFVIPVRIESMESLFDPFDPSPPSGKKLNPQLEEYLLEAIEAVGPSTPLRIQVVADRNSGVDVDVNALISSHFMRKAKSAMAENRRVFRQWRFNLVIGVLFLAVCMSISQFFSMPLFSEHQIADTLRESFGIIGWVALWDPASFILYGWHDSAAKVNSYIRLYLAESVSAGK